MMDCTKPWLFDAGPDWLEPGEQRRQEALWQFARGKAEGEGGVLRRHRFFGQWDKLRADRSKEV